MIQKSVVKYDSRRKESVMLNAVGGQLKWGLKTEDWEHGGCWRAWKEQKLFKW